MAAQSLSARIYWEHMRSTHDDRDRAHQTDLNYFADAVCTQLVALAGEKIDFAPRGLTAEIKDQPDARLIYLWVSEQLSDEIWTSAIEHVGRSFAIMAPRDDWEFADGPADYKKWHEKSVAAGAR